MKKNILIPLTVGGIMVLLGAVVFIIIVDEYNPATFISQFLSSETNSLVFAVLMAFLPLAGFPLVPFLLLVGMIYGTVGGILVTASLMLFHMTASYYLTHSLFRPVVKRILLRFGLPVPQLPRDGGKRFAFIFMIVPGLPYSIKNYFLALTGMPVSTYLGISWIAQFSLAIPFVILGDGVMRMEPIVLAVAAGCLLLALAGQYYLRRQRRKDR